MAQLKTLTDLDDVSMGKIIKYLGVKDIVILRRVSKGLRNYVDISKPHIIIENFEIRVQPNAITCFLDYSEGNSVRKTQTEYRQYYKRSRIRTYKNRRWNRMVEVKRLIEVPDKDYFTAFFEDLQIIWTNRNVYIKHLTVELNKIENNNTRFLEMFESKLTERRTNRVRIGECSATIDQLQDFLRILPYFDPEYLKSLDLETHEVNNKVVMDDIIHFEQFQQLKRFNGDRYFVTNAPLELFLGIDICMIRVENLSIEELTRLRKILMKLPKESSFKRLYINSNLTHSIEQMEMEFGPMNQDRKWFFYTDCGRRLEMRCYPCQFIFEMHRA